MIIGKHVLVNAVEGDEKYSKEAIVCEGMKCIILYMSIIINLYIYI